jgi:hypothetical protein
MNEEPCDVHLDNDKIYINGVLMSRVTAWQIEHTGHRGGFASELRLTIVPTSVTTGPYTGDEMLSQFQQTSKAISNITWEEE